MDDFEKAIVVAFSQGAEVTPEVREQATVYINEIRKRPDICEFCWGQFIQKDRLELKFWCLQSITNAMLSLNLQQRMELRRMLLMWLQDAASNQTHEVAIRNKIALIYVGLLKADYPAAWPSAWQDAIALLDKGPGLVDMFLRISSAFDEEVVSDEVARTSAESEQSQRIKKAIKDGDACRLVECWFTILVTYQQSVPRLVTDCLRVMRVFSVWTEFCMIANDRFLDVICSVIQEAGAASPEACDCLGAILGKKMLAARKMMMFSELRILQRLEACCLHQTTADLLLLEKEAELWNSAAEAVLEVYEDLREQPCHGENITLAQAAWDFLVCLFPTIFWFFSHHEYQMADSIEPFLTALFAKVRMFTNGVLNPEQGPCHVLAMEQITPVMQQSLQLIVQRMAYPDWFQHNDPAYEDEQRHVAFLELRRSLTKMHKKIYLIDDKMVMDFTQASINQLTQHLALARPMEAEAVLHLFREAGDYVGDLAKHFKANGPLTGCFVQIVECQGLIHNHHWAVQLGLLDVYVRYGKIFVVHSEIFARCGQRVLEAMIGSQGIQAQDSRVVTRACFVLSRFARLTRQQMSPLTPQIYDSLKGLLAIRYIPSSLLQPVSSFSTVVPKVVVKGSLKFEDQACLYEAIGILIAAMPSEHLTLALRTLLEGLASHLAEIVAADNLRLAADIEGYTTWAARSVEAIATVSKAFSEKNTGSERDWTDILAIVARLLEKLAAIQSPAGNKAGKDLWRSSLFFCRRMVDVLGDHFLGPLDSLLCLLYAGTDQTDLTELSIFTHHVVRQFQKKAQPLLLKWLPVWFVRPYEMWKELPQDSEQLKRERFELSFHLLELLKECSQRCPSVLLDLLLMQDEKHAHGQQVIQFLMLSLQDPSEIKVFFFATAAWSALLEAAIGAPATQGILASLPLAQLLQQLLWSTARMDFSDAQAQKVLAEVASILRCLTSARLLPKGSQQQAMEALQQALVAALPGLRNDEAPRKLFEVLSQDCSLKEIRGVLQQCVFDWKKDCGA